MNNNKKFMNLYSIAFVLIVGVAYYFIYVKPNKSQMEADAAKTEQSKLSMDSRECIEKVKELVKKNVDTNKWNLLEVSFSEEGVDKLTNKLGYVSVDISNDTGIFSQSFSPEDNRASDLSISFINQDLQPLDINTAVDVDTILKNIEDAKKMIPQGYEFLSMKSYDIMSSESRIYFTVTSTNENEKYVSNAGQKTMLYYNIAFKIDKDGISVYNKLSGPKRQM